MSYEKLSDSSLTCRKCGFEPRLEGFLDDCVSFWPDLQVVRHVCPRCGHADEIQIERGLILFGYTYAAGSAHFAAMEKFEATGLDSRIEERRLKVSYEGRRWTLCEGRGEAD